MRARSRNKSWEPFLDVIFQPLADVPAYFDVITATDGEFEYLVAQIKKSFMVLSAVPWITDMAASKVLHLKRPGVFAISDSYVREALAVREPNSRPYPGRAEYFSERGVSVIRAVRAVGRANLTELLGLQATLAHRVPSYQLSLLRMVDILVWVDMAIWRHHPHWEPVARERGWTTVAASI